MCATWRMAEFPRTSFMASLCQEKGHPGIHSCASRMCASGTCRQLTSTTTHGKPSHKIKALGSRWKSGLIYYEERQCLLEKRSETVERPDDRQRGQLQPLSVDYTRKTAIPTQNYIAITACASRCNDETLIQWSFRTPGSLLLQH